MMCINIYVYNYIYIYNDLHIEHDDFQELRFTGYFPISLLAFLQPLHPKVDTFEFCRSAGWKTSASEKPSAVRSVVKMMVDKYVDNLPEP